MRNEDKDSSAMAYGGLEYMNINFSHQNFCVGPNFFLMMQEKTKEIMQKNQIFFSMPIFHFFPPPQKYTYLLFFSGQFEHFRNRESVFKEYRPFFEHDGRNLTAVTGQSVHLPCGVRNLGDRYVSFSPDQFCLSSDTAIFKAPRSKKKYQDFCQ